MFRKLIVKNKYYLSIVFVAVAPFVFAAVVVWPLFSGIMNFSGQYADLKKELKTLDLKRGFIKDFEKELEAKQADFPKIENSFLDREKVVDFVKSIEKFASENGISAEIKSILESDKSPVQPFILARISAKGDYSGFFKFLRLVENSPVYAAVDSLRMSSDVLKNEINGLAAKNIVEADLILKIYVKNQ